MDEDTALQSFAKRLRERSDASQQALRIQQREAADKSEAARQNLVESLFLAGLRRATDGGNPSSGAMEPEAVAASTAENTP